MLGDEIIFLMLMEFGAFDIILVISAAAAAKLLQSCPTLCNPIDGSPPGSSVHRILQARILERVAISFSTGNFYSRTNIVIYMYIVHAYTDTSAREENNMYI